MTSELLFRSISLPVNRWSRVPCRLRGLPPRVIATCVAL